MLWIASIDILVPHTETQSNREAFLRIFFRARIESSRWSQFPAPDCTKSSIIIFYKWCLRGILPTTMTMTTECVLSYYRYH